VGERVNKIRFVGSINKEVRFRISNAFRLLGKRRKTHVKRKKEGESCDFFNSR